MGIATKDILLTLASTKYNELGSANLVELCLQTHKSNYSNAMTEEVIHR